MPSCSKHQRQARTRMIEVPAGPDNDHTYHIPVSGLKFGTTWQELKDYVRLVADVLHVEVFPISTSGWVRVKGYPNFEKAFQHLNGGNLNGYNIIASDKNRTMPIMVRDVVTGRATRASRPPSPCNACLSSGDKSDGESSTSHTEWALIPGSTSAVAPVDPTHGLATGLAGFEQQAAHISAGMQYVYNMTSSTAYPPALYSQQYATAGMNGHLYYDAKQEPYGSEFYFDSTGDLNTISSHYDFSSMRHDPGIVSDLPDGKVLIKNLPQREATGVFVRELVQMHISADVATKIEEITMGSEQSDKPRSYALLRLAEFVVASGIATVLDGMTVSNHILEARVHADGETSPVNRYYHRDRDAGRKTVDRKDRRDSYKDPGFGYIEDHVPIAPFSLPIETGLTSSEKAKGKGEDKEGRNRETPLVVNGSTSRSKHGPETWYRYEQGFRTEP
ncbi:hypothetical protein GQ53DRAFT_814257 [Thozetella sp. PMI_491]|nr:hypothetical protein GQ53DRAFT_814257 [Thozetella sp. PMI_491]